MAGLLHNNVFDNGLVTLTNDVDKLEIIDATVAIAAGETVCTEVADNTVINGIIRGTKTLTGLVSSPTDREGGGRKVTIAAIVDGTVVSDGTGTHFALVDSTNCKTLAVGKLESEIILVTGTPFLLTSLFVGIPDPAIM